MTFKNSAQYCPTDNFFLHTSFEAKAFKREGGRQYSVFDTPAGEVELEFDQLLLAVGRTANTEGLNYDGTIDALCSLPAAPAPAVLTVKRLRKVPVVTCTVMFPPDEGKPDKKVRFYEGRKVRQMLLMQGVEVGPQCNDDLQCCTSCGMLIRKGKALLEPMGSAERQMLAREPAWRLTCKSVVGPLEKDEEMTIRIRPDLENIMASRDEERAAADGVVPEDAPPASGAEAENEEQDSTKNRAENPIERSWAELLRSPDDVVIFSPGEKFFFLPCSLPSIELGCNTTLFEILIIIWSSNRYVFEDVGGRGCSR